MSISEQDIETMSYADFIGFIGQENTPPGGRTTVSKWGQLSRMNSESNLLDLACSTGFSSRTAAKLFGCNATGIDISKKAIDEANACARSSEFKNTVSYLAGDASCLPFENETFTHIFAGCTFGFINERDQALRECRRVIQKDGFLCIANFYYTSSPPEDLLALVMTSVGFRPNRQWTRAWWNSFFTQHFSVAIEEDNELPLLSEQQIADIVRTFIYDKSKILSGYSENIKIAAFHKLFKTRLILNEHRKYQRFNLIVLEPK